MRSRAKCIRFACVSLALLVGAPCRASDSEDPQESLVVRARQAHATKDDAGLRAVVAADDPWKVVSALCALGDLDVAASLAAFSTAVPATRLAAHVEVWRAWAGDRAVSARLYRELRAAERAIVAGRYPEGVAALTRLALPDEMPASLATRRHFALGIVQSYLGHAGTAIDEMLAAARDHLTKAIAMSGPAKNRPARAAALVQLGILAGSEDHSEEAITALTDAVALERELRDRRGEARALAHLAEALSRASLFADAIARSDEAEQLASELGFDEAIVYAKMARGRTSLRADDAPSAIVAARAGVAKLRSLSRWAPDARDAGLRESWNDLFAVGLEAARRLEDADSFFEFLESGRAWSLREVLGGSDALRTSEISPDLARDLAAATRALRLSRERLERTPGTDFAAVKREREGVMAAEMTVNGVEERIEARQRDTSSLARPATSSLLAVRAVIPPEAGDTGLFSQAEVLRTRVPADLVVLSACETARGRTYRGGGMVGLTRAFLYAGASAVIGGLWRVPDDATSALMVRFYELWRPRDGTNGLPAATALARAQDDVRSQPKWSDPRHWAAWVLVGRPN